MKDLMAVAGSALQNSLPSMVCRQAFLRLEIERKNLMALRLGRRIVVLKEEFDRYLRERQR